MNKKLLSSVSVAAVALAAGISFSSPSGAADIYRAEPAPPPAPFAPPPAISWQGFYVGGHIGAGDAKFSGFFDTTSEMVMFDGANLSGVLGGLQVGYNHDFGNFVAGIEGDWSHMRWFDRVLAFSDSNNAEVQVDNLFSVRARLGITVDPERRGLLYATGGVAWADAKATAYSDGPIDTSVGFQKFKFNKTGWVLGGGFEWAATEAFRLRAETLYYRFNDSKAISPALVGSANPGDFVKFEDVWTVRVGGSWYFWTQ